MKYLTGVSSPRVREWARTHGNLGILITPATSYKLHDFTFWAADNGCFGAGYPGDEKYLAWLQKRQGDAAACLWATAPDIVGDAAATLARSAPMLPRIRALGYKAALVAQDGLDSLDVPWDTFDCLFIGGTDLFKRGPAAKALALEAKRRGKLVHVGRVNSHRMFQLSEYMGADTADGTFLKWNANLPRMQVWLDRSHNELTLFGGGS